MRIGVARKSPTTRMKPDVGLQARHATTRARSATIPRPPLVTQAVRFGRRNARVLTTSALPKLQRSAKQGQSAYSERALSMLEKSWQLWAVDMRMHPRRRRVRRRWTITQRRLPSLPILLLHTTRSRRQSPLQRAILYKPLPQALPLVTHTEACHRKIVRQHLLLLPYLQHTAHQPIL